MAGSCLRDSGVSHHPLGPQTLSASSEGGPRTVTHEGRGCPPLTCLLAAQGSSGLCSSSSSERFAGGWDAKGHTGSGPGGAWWRGTLEVPKARAAGRLRTENKLLQAGHEGAVSSQKMSPTPVPTSHPQSAGLRGGHRVGDRQQEAGPQACSRQPAPGLSDRLWASGREQYGRSPGGTGQALSKPRSNLQAGSPARRSQGGTGSWELCAPADKP